MEKLVSFVQFLILHSTDLVNAAYSVLSAVTSVCAALIAFFILIPGDQPEKAIGGFRDFIAKFSRK